MKCNISCGAAQSLSLSLLLMIVCTMIMAKCSGFSINRHSIMHPKASYILSMTGSTSSGSSNDVDSVYNIKQTIDLTLAKKMSIPTFLSEMDSYDIKGVYAIINDKDEVQYVGSSVTSVVNDIKYYANSGNSDNVKYLRVQTFRDLSQVTSYRNELIKQTNPWGNKLGADWTKHDTATDATATALDDKNGGDSSASVKDRLDTLRQSIERSDADGGVISPFTSNGMTATGSDESTSTSSTGTAIAGGGANGYLEFTKDNIEKVLDEVRPYLIADGGNIAITEIDFNTRSIKLLLQGACGSCPSSTTTMKMGVERVLKENFSNLGDVISVNPPVADAAINDTTIDIATITNSIDKILPAVKAMGGSVVIESVDAATGTVTIKYTGSSKLRTGVELVVKDIKNVKHVIMI